MAVNWSQMFIDENGNIVTLSYNDIYSVDDEKWLDKKTIQDFLNDLAGYYELVPYTAKSVVGGVESEKTSEPTPLSNGVADYEFEAIARLEVAEKDDGVDTGNTVPAIALYPPMNKEGTFGVHPSMKIYLNEGLNDPIIPAIDKWLAPYGLSFAKLPMPNTTTVNPRKPGVKNNTHVYFEDHAKSETFNNLKAWEKRPALRVGYYWKKNKDGTKKYATPYFKLDEVHFYTLDEINKKRESRSFQYPPRPIDIVGD